MQPDGSFHPEWIRRLQDFCTVYEVKMGDLQPDGTLTTVGVPFRDLWPARKAAHEEELRRRAESRSSLSSDSESQSRKRRRQR